MRFGRVGGILLVSVIVGAACANRRIDEDGPARGAIEAADDLYARRADPAALSAAQVAYLALLAEDPDLPSLLWRVAQSYTAQAYGYPDTVDAERGYGLAREYGLRCLALNPAWRSRLTLAEGRIDQRVTAPLTAQDALCMRETLKAWVRWVEIRGPGSHLDLAPIVALANRLNELTNNTDWVAPWALGMASAVPPAALAPDLGHASTMFEESAARAGGVITPRVDQLRRIVAQRYPEEVAYQAAIVKSDFSDHDETGSWALENRRGLEQIEALLAEDTEQQERPSGDAL